MYILYKKMCIKIYCFNKKNICLINSFHTYIFYLEHIFLFKKIYTVFIKNTFFFLIQKYIFWWTDISKLRNKSIFLN